jgi:hypothetical protein
MLASRARCRRLAAHDGRDYQPACQGLLASLLAGLATGIEAPVLLDHALTEHLTRCSACCRVMVA